MKTMRYFAAVAVAVSVSVTGCVKKEEKKEQKREGASVESAVSQADVVTGNNEFALDLYAGLRGKEGNLFLSPFSISTALAMTYAGARGETERQMAEVLHFPAGRRSFHDAFEELMREFDAGEETGGYELVVANALWGQKGYGFLKEYLELTKTCYGGALREVDFKGATEAARNTINAWVEKKTREKIRDLIKPGILSSLTRLVLTNAIYFKGDWASLFEEEMTREEPFTLSSGEKAAVPMMNQMGEFGYAEGEGLQVLELPYAGDRLSMVVILPGEADGLSAVEKSLTAESLSARIASLEHCKVRVSLPKFTMTSEFSLADVLTSLGMAAAFSLPPADFSGMDGRKDLFISAVIHKAFVEVNEEGTEAAAATAVIMDRLSAPIEPVPVFRAARPFLFLIRDMKTGSILFMGRLSQPEGDSRA